MNELPPVVIGDSTIDAINAIAWSLSVPENGDAIQLLQRAVVVLERTANKEKKHADED